MQPYYTIMTLPGENEDGVHPDAAVHARAPRTTWRRGWWRAAIPSTTASCVVFQFPKQKIVYGPRQIIGRINQDQVISPQITLWNQQGSEVIWGTLLVIPIKESLIYVRPLYLRSPQSSIPELKRVIVAYQNQIVMAETLTRRWRRSSAASVANGPRAGPAREHRHVGRPDGGLPIDPEMRRAPSARRDDLAALAAEAQTHFDNAEKAQRAGDWALYGEEMQEAAVTSLDRCRRLK